MNLGRLRGTKVIYVAMNFQGSREHKKKEGRPQK